MKITQFNAQEDLVGRRILIGWTFEPETGETIADIPPVVLRRKIRDFEFPGSSPEADAYNVYDSSEFPPAPVAGVLEVTDLPGWKTTQGAEQIRYEAVSVADYSTGRALERLRRTVSTTYNATGVAVSRSIEILDNGGQPFSLQPGTTYYYQLFSAGIPTDADIAEYRSTTTAGEGYALNRKLYELLPEVYRRHDVVQRPVTPGTEYIPEATVRFGQFRRFLDIFGTALDSMRSSAQWLLNLKDIDATDYRYMPLMAQWLGWKLTQNEAIPLQRNEIKSASRLYRSVGTVSGLRAIVDRYSGWESQVAEFAQHISLSNQPPKTNLFVSAEISGQWSDTLDASRALGFGPGNRDDAGTGVLPAVLTGTAAEPFSLHSGMTLTVAVDNGLPVKLRLAEADFANITQASAAEVAAVFNNVFSEFTTQVVSGGHLRLTTENTGNDSSLQIQAAGAGLVSLNGAPFGRIQPVTDSLNRSRVFFESHSGSVLYPYTVTSTSAQQGQLTRQNRRHLYYKTHAYEQWRDAHSVDALDTEANQGYPTATVLSDDRVLLAWIDDPDTGNSRIKYRMGDQASALPARVSGKIAGPYALVNGANMSVTGMWGTQVFTVNSADYADITSATALEVVNAINAQLTDVIAGVSVDGSVSLQTTALGPQVFLTVDLQHSNTARVLGFEEDTSVWGSWDEDIRWYAPGETSIHKAGYYADLFSMADPSGGIRLFWSTHQAGNWRLYGSHWNDRTIIVTANGVSIRSDAGVWTQYTTVNGLANNNVRSSAVDADGNAWFATAGGVSRLRPDGTWLTLNSGSGLNSDNIRDLKIDIQGRVWIGSDSGVNVYNPVDASLLSYTTADGLPSNDVRGVAIDADETTWFATAAGLGQRTVYGQWQTINAAGPLPSNDVRSVTFGAQQLLLVATAAGAAYLDLQGQWTVWNTGNGLLSNDVRDMANDSAGNVWIATAAGLTRRSAQGVWTYYSVTSAMVSNDTTCVNVPPQGGVWVGTTAGISIMDEQGQWQTITHTQGLIDDSVTGIHGPWSAAQQLVQGQTSDREPCAVVDDSNRTWLIWSRQQDPKVLQDHWLLYQQRFDSVTGLWSTPQAITATVPGTRAADREPMAINEPGAGPRVFFSSDRQSGRNVWWLFLDNAGTPSPLSSLSTSAAINQAPAALRTVAGDLWLFFRSDDNVPLGQLQVGVASDSSRAPFSTAIASKRIGPDASLRRFAGTTSIVMGHVGRHSRRRQWGDLMCYTPQRPTTSEGGVMQADEFYSRGTVGLYISRGRTGQALTRDNIARVQQLLAEFLPINLRAVMVLTPSVYTEWVYSDDYDIQESYRDNYPNVDVYTGLLDSTSAALPDWVLFLSNTVADVTANTADLTSLRNRTYFPAPD